MGVTERSPTRNPMFQYDETLANLVFDYCRRRLSLEPVPLDLGGFHIRLQSIRDGGSD